MTTLVGGLADYRKAGNPNNLPGRKRALLCATMVAVGGLSIGLYVATRDANLLIVGIFAEVVLTQVARLVLKPATPENSEGE